MLKINQLRTLTKTDITSFGGEFTSFRPDPRGEFTSFLEPSCFMHLAPEGKASSGLLIVTAADLPHSCSL